jgi:hypothetical protein
MYGFLIMWPTEKYVGAAGLGYDAVLCCIDRYHSSAASPQIWRRQSPL